MKKINILIIFIILLINSSNVYSNDEFEIWKNNFKTYANNQGISSNTINFFLNNSKFLPDVIKYDRYQPEFYEDTKTYVKELQIKK